MNLVLCVSDTFNLYTVHLDIETEYSAYKVYEVVYSTRIFWRQEYRIREVFKTIAPCPQDALENFKMTKRIALFQRRK